MEDLGNSEGALDSRADPQNLPAGLTKEPWPRNAFASLGGGDYGTAYVERAEIYDLDLGGHGYAKVRLSTDEMRTEFVCVPRPIARSERPDGGPIRYRVLHTAALWKSGQRPQLKTSVLEGDVGLSI